jgi:pimeloyl-ACP methyl ester carboxylesterase
MRSSPLILSLVLAACGGGHGAAPADDTAHGALFSDRAYTPKSFVAKVTGSGRPVIFIPGLGCPGEMWDGTIDKLHGVQAHVLTLAGFAGRPPVKPPLAATVRKELVRYIRGNKLDKPILVGHSMGGTIAYWVAETAPDLIGGAIVVDAGPALSDTDPATARALRNMWAQAGDDELPEQVKTAYSGMVADPAHIAPFIDAIAKSDRQTMGDSIFELVKTDLRPQLAQIHAPLLLVLADGGYGSLYRTQIAAVPNHDVVVVPKTKHFVMLDAPDALAKLVDQFVAAKR